MHGFHFFLAEAIRWYVHRFGACEPRPVMTWATSGAGGRPCGLSNTLLYFSRSCRVVGLT
eukprot:212614-Chlamydomonas_euryale.AAC.1